MDSYEKDLENLLNPSVACTVFYTFCCDGQRVDGGGRLKKRFSDFSQNFVI